MSVRLNITMEDDLYRQLKAELPPKKISAFINEAVREKLRPDRATLDAAYKAAQKDRFRSELSASWEATEIEG